MSTESATTPRMLASHHMRLFALIVDYLLVVVVLKLGHQALLGAGWELETDFASQGTPGTVWATALIALGLLKDTVGGRSPGKWLTGLAVVRADDPTRKPSNGDGIRTIDVGPGDFLDGDAGGHVIRPLSPVLLGDVDSHETQFRHLAELLYGRFVLL